MASGLIRMACAAVASGWLAGCASMMDAPRLLYRCPHELQFEARLYQDMAILEGQRGHVVLQRQAATEAGADAVALRYADETVQAEFGLGLDKRLVALRYAGIPAPVFCERDAARSDDVIASERPGPRPPAWTDPNAPVQTNLQLGDGPWPN